MPIVIALDVSLSMCRPLGKIKDISSDVEHLSRTKLALDAINQFLDHLTTQCKLEYVSLLTFSHETKVLVPFTRDFESIRSQLVNVTEEDRTNYKSLLEELNSYILDCWGDSVLVQILLITDGSSGYGEGSLRATDDATWDFRFPARMNIFCLSDPAEKDYSENCFMLQNLISNWCVQDGIVYFPESSGTSNGCFSAISRLCAKDFTPYKGTLQCGQLSSKITLYPPPQPDVDWYEDEEEGKRYEISETIEIIGFITTSDLASPAALSRHLILPWRPESGFANAKVGEEQVETEGAIPNFCVLLHGAMKSENISAIVQVADNWFGYIFSWADSKKKSNLMLSLWPRGNEPLPWLGNLQELGSREELVTRLSSTYMNIPSGSTTLTLPTFPVKYFEKRSYASSPTVWTTPEGINNDIQKLLRHARKLPEKTTQFYKELNRMRRWALTIGFTDMLDTMAQVLERECMTLSAPKSSAQADAVFQMSHAVDQLRAKLPYTKNIIPRKI